MLAAMNNTKRSSNESGGATRKNSETRSGSSASNTSGNGSGETSGAIGHPSDTYISPELSKLIPGLRLYEQLVEEEKKIDTVIKRRKLTMNQTIQRIRSNLIPFREAYNLNGVKQTTYLRVFISSVSENQLWQNPDAKLEDGGWTMRIEGRLVDSKQGGSATRDKFSSFIDGIRVEFKKPKKDEQNSANKDDDNNNSTAGNNNDNDIESNESSAEGFTREPSESAPQFFADQTPNPLGTDISNPPTVTDMGSASEITTPYESNKLEKEDQIQEIVEWKADPKKPVEFDGFDIKRNGNTNLDAVVTIYPKAVESNRYSYSPALASLVGLSHGSKSDAIFSLYKYINANNLLVSREYSRNTSLAATIVSSRRAQNVKNVVKLDEPLMKLLSRHNSYSSLESTPTTVKLTDIPSIVERNLEQTKPVRLNYTVRVDKASTYGEVVFDMEVPTKEALLQSISMKGQKRPLITDNLAEESQAILRDYEAHITKTAVKNAELDKKLAILHAQLNSTKMKHQFYKKFAEDPANALKEYIESTSGALKVLSGDEGFLEDTVRRSQFYKENEQILEENISVLFKHERI